MRKYEYRDGNFRLKRITKGKARGIYEKGLYVILCPSNLRPGAPWHPEVHVASDGDVAFDDIVNRFAWYNCTSMETGKRVNFYAPVTQGYMGDVYDVSYGSQDYPDQVYV